VCSNESYPLAEAVAENYTAILWTTSGDGTFDDATAMNPEYTPGSGDAASGQATLTLTAAGNVGCGDAVSELVLAVESAPEAFAGQDNAIQPGSSYTINDATAANYGTLLWSTSGDGAFDDAGLVNPTYTPGANDIEAKEVTLTLTLAGTDPCGEATDDMMLSVNTGIGENTLGFDIRVYPNPNTGDFTLELSGQRDETLNLRIYNALGDEVYARENVEVRGTHYETISLEVEQGIYYLRIDGDELLVNKKIMIQK
jgi:hypothetical protein